MSRLIDADKLIEILEENNQKLQEQIKDERVEVQKVVYEAQLFTGVDIIKLIKEQPTAFDVDKVLEQLEEESILAEKKVVVCLDEAIEIVEAGGKE